MPIDVPHMCIACMFVFVLCLTPLPLLALCNTQTPDHLKTPSAQEAFNPNGLSQRTIRLLKDAFPDVEVRVFHSGSLTAIHLCCILLKHTIKCLQRRKPVHNVLYTLHNSGITRPAMY
jgi:Na+/H+-dicarboxylate symporter